MRLKKLAAASSAALVMLALTACGGFEAPADAGSDPSGGAGGTEAETVLKVAFNQNADHPQAVALTSFGERLAERTEGRYSVEVYPNETLGTQKDTIELVQAGSIDLAMIAGSLMENFNEDFVVFNLPYTFDSQEHQKAVINDPEITGDLYSSVEDQNISVLAGFHGGIRNVYNSARPVEKPEDLAGMKIRVIESDTNLRMMELMGGTGTPMGQGDVYTAIQSGVIDGGENNESIYANLKHDEIAPYYSYTRHLMFPDYLIANPALLEGMSEEDRTAFQEELAAAIDEEAELWKAEIEASHAAAEEAGAQFNEVDTEAFRTALQPLIEEKLASDVAKDLYDQVRAAAE
jgi:tripartite ATP-independent transporter DctP family solute receptor